MARYALFVLVALLTQVNLFAQDAHFSQYYTFAQNLNPALTANYEGSYRVALMHRNQWASFLDNNGFMTTGAALDLSILDGQLGADKLGLGLVMQHDRFGQGSLTSIQGGLSLAYHKAIGRFSKHRISIGAQTAFQQRRLDESSLLFYDQFDNYSHGAFGPTDEAIIQGNSMFFDFGAGLYWKARLSDRLLMQAGFSAWHIHKPTEFFIAESQDAFLPVRYQADLAAEIFLNDKMTFSLQPDVFVNFQGEAQETLIGAFVGHYFSTGFRNRSGIHGGFRARLNKFDQVDALIAMLAVEFRNFRIGGAYDINLSGLSAVSQGNGGFEISLVYIGEGISKFKADRSLPARRF